MRRFFVLVLFAILGTAVSAQESELLTLRVEARLDYMNESIHGNKVDAASGFKGRYLNLRMDGNITDGLSYSYRQRLNKPQANATFFDATDWLTLTYTYKNWSFSGGKQVVAIGGYEYDKAPIDLYFCSEFWNNIPCYQIGVSGAYTTDDGNDKILIQFCESPFRKNASNVQNKEMFAYNLIWYGAYGIYSSMYSVNFIEYLPGKFINYVALGNRLTFGQFTIDLDLMDRVVLKKNVSGIDLSVMGEVAWRPMDCLNVFVRATYDLNDTDVSGDWCVLPGTDIFRVGGGIEYFPFKNYRNVRLHMNYCYTDGVSPSTAALQSHQSIFDAGVTWHMNLLNIRRRK